MIGAGIKMGLRKCKQSENAGGRGMRAGQGCGRARDAD